MYRQALLARAASQRFLVTPARFSSKDLFANVEKFPTSFKATTRVIKQNEQGFYEPYRADYTRNSAYPEGALPGLHSQTTARFFLNTLKRNVELYPLWACIAFWAVLFSGQVYWAFSKREVILNRSDKLHPCTDWEKERNHYHQWNGVLSGETKGKRIPTLEILMDEMVEAAKARGTR